MKAGDVVRAVTVRVDLDPFLDLRALAGYASLSRRTLQALVNDAEDPLPSYKVGGKILVRRSEFDQWMARRRNRRPLAAAALAQADAQALLAARPRDRLAPLDKPRGDAYKRDTPQWGKGGEQQALSLAAEDLTERPDKEGT